MCIKIRTADVNLGGSIHKGISDFIDTELAGIPLHSTWENWPVLHRSRGLTPPMKPCSQSDSVWSELVQLTLSYAPPLI